MMYWEMIENNEGLKTVLPEHYATKEDAQEAMWDRSSENPECSYSFHHVAWVISSFSCWGEDEAAAFETEAEAREYIAEHPEMEGEASRTYGEEGYCLISPEGVREVL